MSVKITISLAAVDEKIDHYIREQENEPYENGPIALEELYKFVIEGVAKNWFAVNAEVCSHVRRRLQEYAES